MIRYTLHNIETGEVIQSGVCPDKDCLPEKPDGAIFTFGVMANPDTDIMQNGKAVRRTENAGD